MSGTSLTAKKDFLSGEEVCKIIETCAKRRVSKLKLGDLSLEFEPSARSRHNTTAPGPALPDVAPETVIREQEKEQEDQFIREEVNLREDQIENLLLEDPLRAEELMEQEFTSPEVEEGQDGELSYSN